MASSWTATAIFKTSSVPTLVRMARRPPGPSRARCPPLRPCPGPPGSPRLRTARPTSRLTSLPLRRVYTSLGLYTNSLLTVPFATDVDVRFVIRRSVCFGIVRRCDRQCRLGFALGWLGCCGERERVLVQVGHVGRFGLDDFGCRRSPRGRLCRPPRSLCLNGHSSARRPALSSRLDMARQLYGLS